MKILSIFSLAVAALATTSWAFLDGCLEKRLPRELEFKLMYDCVSNNCARVSGGLEEKIQACSCFIGSMICEQSEKELQQQAKDGSNTCSITHNTKKFDKCLEKKKKE